MEEQKCRDGLHLDIVLFHPIGTECQQGLSSVKRKTAGGYGKHSPREMPCTIWQVDDTGPMLVAPGGYKWVLVGIDNYSGLGVTYPVVDANAQNTIK